MKSTRTIFSAIQRKEILTQLQAKQFDLLVIGGGVTGCGIALDAATRGLSVALIEKQDFASGTSSKSTKLIHGGLRYLKQFEIGLVRETGTERAVAHRLAPHLVLPEKMLLPLIEHGTYGKLATSFGLKVYDILANVKGKDQRRMLNKKDTLALEPLLNEKVLKGSGFYAEYRTDDARLTIELIKTAARKGAIAANYCKAENFIYEEGKVKGVQCKDEISGEQFEIKAQQVVSACGPWVDKLRKINNSLEGKRLQLTKGVHIVVPHEKLPLNYSIYFDVPDGRMMFAIPRGKVTYIGTSDTTYSDNLNRIIVTKEDANYLISAVNNAFPSIHLTMEDLISNWAGLRPLIHEDGKSPSELSRKDEIFESDSNLISIAGGKLTGYRKMAQRIVDLVIQKRDDLAFVSCKTRDLPITPQPLADSNAVENYIKKLKAQVAEHDLAPYYAWYLATTYGTQADMILEKMPTLEANSKEIQLLRAELWFSVQHEMVQSITDFFVRRTGRLYFNIESIAPALEVLLADLQEYLAWDNQRLTQERERMQELIHDATYYYAEEMVAKSA